MASTDDAATNAAFAAEHNAGFPVLSDPEGTTAAAYGVLGERGYAARWTFYIDPAGRIAAIDKTVKPTTAGADIVRNFNRLEVPPR